MASAREGATGTSRAAGGESLVAWAARSGRPHAGGPVRGGLGFVFYGRVSTEDWQDRVTSRARQREQAGALVGGRGQVVAEFFDAGESRTVAWGRRREAARLAALLADPGRGWDAVVAGSTSGRSTAASVAARFDQPGLRGARARLLGPYLGGIPLAELAPGDVQAMFTAIIRNQGVFGHRSSRYGGPLAWSDGG